jgi:hypothetical protein
VLWVRKFETTTSQSGDSTRPTHLSSSSNSGDFFGSLARCMINFHSIPYTSKQTFLHLRVIRLINDYSTIGMKNIARDVTGIRTGKEHKTSRDLTWLSSSLHWSSNAKVFETVFAHRCKYQRRNNRTGSNKVGTNPLGYKLSRN